MELYPAIDSDRVSVKINTIKSVIALINDGDYATAIDYLDSIIDPDFRNQVRKTKEELYFKMKYSRTAQERALHEKEYRDYMTYSLL